ncbi:Transcription initiation factor TFIID subunit 3 [Hondaea fermentalgiana]|uniref:Transcription initiation factor TFIID subunit 8 n=1 Tax=Hondaea fermentalgiana TaxID=2315210 RepID=A0A2R5G741_9STRA|nr:Transcription initiation factor TFIID subunit 3 [Hondaea fermentalgiana]|eukprot:GBG26872.1 Transcription initiation factor TFIID subunit 3 [Hondaea fermentalgiana]
MSDQFAHQVLRIAVAQICRSKEFGDFDAAAEGHAFDTFVDVIGKYIEKIGRLCRTYAEHDGRTESNLLDLLQAFDRLEPNRVDWRDLERMCREVPWQVPYTTGIPNFPVDKRPRRAQQYGEKRKSALPSSTAADLLASAKRQKTDGEQANGGTEHADAAGASLQGASAATANGEANKSSLTSGEGAAANGVSSSSSSTSSAAVAGGGSTADESGKAKDSSAASAAAGAADGTANNDKGSSGTSSNDKNNKTNDNNKNSDKMEVDSETKGGAEAKDKKKSKNDKSSKASKSRAKSRQEDTLEHPLFVPSHFPSFPERYTYSYTYVDATKRETDPKAILERSLEDKRRVQEALVRISQGSGTATKHDGAFGEPADDRKRGGAANAGAAQSSAAEGKSSATASSQSAGSSAAASGTRGPDVASERAADTLPSLPSAFS